MRVYCCNCEDWVEARFVKGDVIYPHRPDLANLDFLMCPNCHGYTGYRNTDKVVPTIPTPELRNARRKIHAVIDPLWKKGKITRAEVYRRLSAKIGKPYHNSTLSTLKEATAAYDEAVVIAKELGAL